MQFSVISGHSISSFISRNNVCCDSSVNLFSLKYLSLVCRLFLRDTVIFKVFYSFTLTLHLADADLPLPLLEANCSKRGAYVTLPL